MGDNSIEPDKAASVASKPIPFIRRQSFKPPHVPGEATLEEALSLIREAKKVFVWCDLAPKSGRFFLVGRDEALRALAHWDGPYVELSVSGDDVWLG